MSELIHPEALRSFDRKPWSWRDPSRGEHYRTCSWCGSINPDDLAAEPTWQPSWADQKYGWPHKFYVDIPNREPDRLYVIGMSSHNDQPPGSDWIRWEDLTEEQRQAVITDGWKVTEEEHPAAVILKPRQYHRAKFYTIHLADNIDLEVKRTIQNRSGLQFHFAGGQVAWQTAPKEA